ncbi:MAG: tetratricopeptide repeat protein [Georgfuchsia sp.]
MTSENEIGALLSVAVPPPTRWRSEAPITFEKQRFLVVDDQSVSRQSLRISIIAMGGVSVGFVASQNEALYQISIGRMPSIILCDYDLGKGRNGQQFLEEIRIGNLIPDETIFMMVTAERSYEQVVAAVELAPDDYILKPFTPEALRLRLDRLVRKKLFFTRFFGLKRSNDIDAAVAELNALEARSEGAVYRFEIMRSRAEVLLHANRIDEARSAYEAILDIRPFPWAKAGLARCLASKDDNHNARMLLEEVIKDAPNYLSAIDLQATVCTALGDYTEAQRMLELGVSRNPANWKRQRKLSDAAVANGDMDTARKAMDTMIRLATTPGALGPSDLIAMARLKAEQGDTSAAAATLAKIPQEQLNDLEHAQRLSLIAMRTMIDPSMKAEFESHRRTFFDVEQPGVELGIDVVYAALSINDIELATKYAMRLLTCTDTLKTFQPLLAAFKKAGHENTLRQVQKAAAQTLIERQQQSNGIWRDRR